MKIGESEVEVEGEAPEGIDPNDLLHKGTMLCEMGESLIAAAKAMGADEPGEEVYEEGAPVEEEEAPAEEEDSLGARKRGIIALISKKLAK